MSLGDMPPRCSIDRTWRNAKMFSNLNRVASRPCRKSDSTYKRKLLQNGWIPSCKRWDIRSKYKNILDNISYIIEIKFKARNEKCIICWYQNIFKKSRFMFSGFYKKKFKRCHLPSIWHRNNCQHVLPV